MAAGDARLIEHRGLVESFVDLCKLTAYSGRESIDVPRFLGNRAAMPDVIRDVARERLAELEKDPRPWVKLLVNFRQSELEAPCEGRRLIDLWSLSDPPCGWVDALPEDVQQEIQSIQDETNKSSKWLKMDRWNPFDRIQWFFEAREAAGIWTPVVQGKYGRKLYEEVGPQLHFRGWYDELSARFGEATGEVPIPLRGVNGWDDVDRFAERWRRGIERRNCLAVVIVQSHAVSLFDFCMPPGLIPEADEEESSGPQRPEAERAEVPGPKSSNVNDADVVTNEMKAIGLLAKHPHWSMRQIADAVDVSVSTLSSRYPLFRKAWDAAHPKDKRAAGRPRGHKDEDGNIESYSDDE